MADQLADNLAKLKNGSKYSNSFPDHIQSLKGKGRFVDNKKATEHHAIVPTGLNPIDLTEKEERLYELILKHTLAAFHPEGIDKQVTVITEVAGETFQTNGVVVLVEGWRKILRPDEEENEGEGPQLKIPVLPQGEPARVDRSETKAGKTTPPKRLTEAHLEEAMENAGKIVEDMDDDEALQQLKEKGIGTPATRTAIIKNLKDMAYIETKKNLVYLTDKGQNFISLIHEHPIASIELTGEFEKKLEEVAQGKRPAMDTLKEFIQYAHDIVGQKDALFESIKNKIQDKPMFQKADEEIAECPKCGKPVVVRDEFYGCSGYKEGCKFTLPKEYLGKKLSAAQIRKLLTKGKTDVIKGFTSGKGQLDSAVSYNKETKRLAFVKE